MLQDDTPLTQRLADRAPLDVPAVYVHVPFCLNQCHYCDFYTEPAASDRLPGYLDRLADEIHAWQDLLADRPVSLYIGGGTPTVLPAALLQRLLDLLGQTLRPAPAAEWTIEANPETLCPAVLEILLQAGVNRLSIGAQSFHPRLLATLGRRHRPATVQRAVRLARRAGMTNINLDLIFAIPGQTLTQWQADLHAALALEPTHLSCYALTCEPHTPLARRLAGGQLQPCGQALEAAMYEAAIDLLADAGFEHYEISNWAALPHDHRPSPYRCRHNLAYWLNHNYLAFGPAAAGHVNGLRWKNVPDLDRYLHSTGPAPATDIEQLAPDRRLGEQLMLRLRLVEGIEHDWLDDRLDPRRSAVIANFVEQGLLENTAGTVRLTRRGLLLADTVCAELL